MSKANGIESRRATVADLSELAPLFDAYRVFLRQTERPRDGAHVR